MRLLILISLVLSGCSTTINVIPEDKECTEIVRNGRKELVCYSIRFRQKTTDELGRLKNK